MNSTIILSSNQNTSCVNVSVLADSVVEDQENFLVAVTSFDVVANITTPTGTISVIDQTTGMSMYTTTLDTTS